MNLEIFILNEVNQTKTNIIWYHFYVELKKKFQNQNSFTNTEKVYSYQIERRGGGCGEVWIKRLGITY